MLSLQTNNLLAQNGYPDPDQIRVVNERAIDQCVSMLFSKYELCSLKGGVIKYECWLDVKGKISCIKRKDKGIISIEAKKDIALSELLKEKVIFHVPKAFASKKMESFRKAIIFIPTKVNCRSI